MSADAFKQQMAALSAEYRAALPERMAKLQALWSAAQGGESGALADMLRELHTLAGSARTFGLPGLSEHARAAEQFLEPFCRDGASLGEADRAGLSRLLEAVGRNAA